MRANPFKHQLQGQVYAEAIQAIRRRIGRLPPRATVRINPAGKVTAPMGPPIVYVLKVGKRPVLDQAFTDLNVARREAQFIATALDVEVEVADQKNLAFVARRGSNRKTAATYGMSVNPSLKRVAKRTTAAAWSVVDRVGNLIATAKSEAAAYVKAQAHADSTGRRVFVQGVKRGRR